jgi:hypothetical protein
MESACSVSPDQADRLAHVTRSPVVAGVHIEALPHGETWARARTPAGRRPPGHAKPRQRWRNRSRISTGRRLARPVRAQEREDLAVVNIKVDALDHLRRPYSFTSPPTRTTGSTCMGVLTAGAMSTCSPMSSPRCRGKHGPTGEACPGFSSHSADCVDAAQSGLPVYSVETGVRATTGSETDPPLVRVDAGRAVGQAWCRKRPRLIRDGGRPARQRRHSFWSTRKVRRAPAQMVDPQVLVIPRRAPGSGTGHLARYRRRPRLGSPPLTLVTLRPRSCPPQS